MDALPASPRYVSTRSTTPPVRFEEALLRGLAPDGGLYLPTAIPPLPEGWDEPETFAEVAVRALMPWLQDEVPPATLDAIVKEALAFPVPLVPLAGDGWTGVHVLELFHGPTLSFKDFGARTMARLMAHFLAGREERLTILVATSGDTGSAVADGFAGRDQIDVVMLYPKGQVSAVQERQLIVERPGVRTFAVAGTFDDCQRMVKAAFMDPELAGLGLSSANSINIGRLLPQMLYYLWAARHFSGEAVQFCVPSGNLGNLTAGVLAGLSGLPVRSFLAAHNANDFFPRFLAGEDAAFAGSVRTLSNAMDVGAPSNFERLRTLVPLGKLRQWVAGERVTDAETVESMRRVYDATGYVADPHTAVGLEAVRRTRAAASVDAPMIVLSTAHPSKFPDTVAEALGQPPDAPDRLARLWALPTRAEPLAPSADALKVCLLSR